MGDQNNRKQNENKDRKEALTIFKELWSKSSSPLHRMYSSWEELERNVQVKTDDPATTRPKTHRCPYCGEKQNIVKPLSEAFPYEKCTSCGQLFNVDSDFKVSKLSDTEAAEIPGGWVQIVDDFAKKKVAVVFSLE